MGRRRHKKRSSGAIAGATGEQLTGLLKARAVTHTRNKGHEIGQWISVKNKFGKGSQKAVCKTCAKAVIIAPYGPIAQKDWEWAGSGFVTVRGVLMSGGTRRGKPSLRGAALFEQCEGGSDGKRRV